MKTHPHHRGPHLPTTVTAAQSSQTTAAPSSTKTSANSTEDNLDVTPRIAEVAYFMAMERGFTGGDPLQDWLEAERSVLSHVAPAKR
jgi:Protein of unknown function (DUF2934)